MRGLPQLSNLKHAGPDGGSFTPSVKGWFETSSERFKKEKEGKNEYLRMVEGEI